MPQTNEHIIPAAPTETLAPEPPRRDATGAIPLPDELQARLNGIQQQDVSPAGYAAAA